MSRPAGGRAADRVVDAAIVVVACGAGALGPYPWTEFYWSLGLGFSCVVLPLLTAAAGLRWVFDSSGERLQGPRRRPPLLSRELFETTRAMFVVACLMAWPMTQYRLGYPTGLKWNLAEAGGLWVVLGLNLVVGILVIDAWTYLKHRLLHTRLLFRFHRHHHAFRDPTPFAGFAISPLEAVLTFWPLLLVCIPEANHWAPLYFTLVVAFVLLNLYLHSGVKLGWLEATLPRIFLNTSAFHNLHHARVDTNYGEVLFLWDVLLNTADRDNPHHPRSAIGRDYVASSR